MTFHSKKLFYMIDILCNEKCSKCHHWMFNSVKEVKDSKLIIDFANSINNLDELCIVGGEPLIYKNIILEIINGVNKNIKVVIITNGVLLTQHFINSIINKNVHIVFSIDTVDKDFWKFVRGNDTYDKVITNLYYAYQTLNRQQISIQSVLALETKTHIKNVKKFCDSLGLYHSVQNYISDGFMGSWTPLNEDKDKMKLGNCIAHKQNISIMANGDIFTCFQQNLIKSCEKPIGNISKDKYCDIISSDYYESVIDKMKSCHLPCKVLKCNIGEDYE